MSNEYKKVEDKEKDQFNQLCILEGTLEKYKDDENKYAAQSGTFEAYARMDNDTFKRAIKTIEEIEKNIKT